MPTAENRPELAPASFTAPDGAAWLALRTKARAEKVAAAYCRNRALGIVYLPLQRSVRRYDHGPRTHYKPLLPGYLFAACTPEQSRLLQLECSAICGSAPTTPTSASLLLKDLIALRELELAQIHGHLEVRPEVVVGKIVKINHGPLRGVAGIVERRAGKTRITVNVEVIGQSATLEIDVDEVTLETS